MSTVRDRPLVAARLRGTTYLLLLLSAATTAGLALIVRGDRTALAADARVAAFLAHLPLPPADVQWAVVLLGDPLPTAVASVLLSIGALIAGRRRGAALALVAPVAAAASAWFLQPSIARTLRDVDAFPSGHTVTTSTLAAISAILLLGAGGPAVRGISVALIAAVLCVPIIVAVFLVRLNLHYASDTIGGATLSLTVVLGVALSIDELGDRAARRRTPREGGQARGGSRSAH